MNGSINDSSSIAARRWASIAISGFLTFVFIIVLMHLIHPELASSNRFMSELTFGEYGWLLNIAFFGNLIGSIALIIAIYQSYPPPLRPWTSIICLGIATVSILTNFFPTDLHGNAITVSGYVHNIGAFIGSIAGLLFMFVLTIRLKIFGLLQGSYQILLLLAIIAPVFFMAMLVFFEQMSGFVGIVQRLFAAIVLTSLIITSNGLRSGAITPI